MHTQVRRLVGHEAPTASVGVGWEHSDVTTKRSDFGSLTDRTAGLRNIDPDRSLPVGVHIWIRGGADEVPGLLCGWRHGSDGWWGRVIVVSDGQPSENLIRADLLRKA